MIAMRAAGRLLKNGVDHTKPQHILRRDSGPWEHHLPGKQFVFTNAVCARGLQMLDELDRQFGKPDPNMAENVQKMLKGIDAQFLVGNRFYKGNAQESSPDEHYFFDGATFEIFACGLVNDKSLFRSHMLEYDRHLLAAKDPARGYIRFDSQDSYENQEWPFAGLRVAVAEKRLGSVLLVKEPYLLITNLMMKDRVLNKQYGDERLSCFYRATSSYFFINFRIYV